VLFLPEAGEKKRREGKEGEKKKVKSRAAVYRRRHYGSGSSRYDPLRHPGPLIEVKREEEEEGEGRSKRKKITQLTARPRAEPRRGLLLSGRLAMADIVSRGGGKEKGGKEKTSETPPTLSLSAYQLLPCRRWPLSPSNPSACRTAFFTPSSNMPMVEGREKGGGKKEREEGSAGRKLGKTPVPREGLPGFLVNRVLHHVR